MGLEFRGLGLGCRGLEYRGLGLKIESGVYPDLIMMLANSVFYLLKGTARLRVWVSGLAFGVWCLGFRVQRSGFQVWVRGLG